MEKTIYNPIQKDTVTFLKTSTDTHGAYTLVKVELADGGGAGLHYHKTYSEKFDCLEGNVQVQLGKTMHTLSPGESATAEPNINHLFRNRSGNPCKLATALQEMVNADPTAFPKINWPWPGCSTSHFQLHL